MLVYSSGTVGSEKGKMFSCWLGWEAYDPSPLECSIFQNTFVIFTQTKQNKSGREGIRKIKKFQGKFVIPIIGYVYLEWKI